MFRSTALASMAAIAAMGELASITRASYPHGRAPPSARRIYPCKPPTNGKREVARRLRQIEAGQLKVSN